MKEGPSLWDRWWLSGFSKRALAFFFSLTLFLLFLYVLGNFQEFLESTQLMILGLMRNVAYLTTLAVILFILAEIFQKKDPPLTVLANVTGSFMIGLFTAFLYLAVSLLFTLVQNVEVIQSSPSGTLIP